MYTGSGAFYAVRLIFSSTSYLMLIILYVVDALSRTLYGVDTRLLLCVVGPRQHVRHHRHASPLSYPAGMHLVYCETTEVLESFCIADRQFFPAQTLRTLRRVIAMLATISLRPSRESTTVLSPIFASFVFGVMDYSTENRGVLYNVRSALGGDRPYAAEAPRSDGANSLGIVWISFLPSLRLRRLVLLTTYYFGLGRNLKRSCDLVLLHHLHCTFPMPHPEKIKFPPTGRATKPACAPVSATQTGQSDVVFTGRASALNSLIDGIRDLTLDGSLPSTSQAINNHPMVPQKNMASEHDRKTSWIDLDFEATFQKAELPLQVIMPWKFVLCTDDDCQVGIAGDNISRHLLGHRPALHIPNQLLAALRKEGIWWRQADIHGHLPHGIIGPIPGMVIQEGQQCNHPGCLPPLFVGDKADTDLHFQKNHSNTPFKQLYLRNIPCHMFRLYRQPSTPGAKASSSFRYFRVHPTLEYVDIRTEYGLLHRYLLEKETWELPVFRSPKSENELTPWLRKTRWHMLIDGADPVVVKARIVAEYAPDWLQPLVDHVTRYISVLEARRKDVNPIVFTMLPKESDAQKNSTTINDYGKDYAKPWAALLQFIILQLEDPVESFPVPMSEEVAMQAVQLAVRLKAADSPAKAVDTSAILTRIQAVFFALLSTCHGDLRQDQTACPLVRYIALDCLEIGRGGCKFMQPSQCRYKLRAFEYLFRMCIVQEAYQQSTAARPTTEIVAELLRHVQCQEGDHLSAPSTWAVLQHIVWLATSLDKGMTRPNVFWSEDSQELTHMGMDEKLTMPRIQDYIDGLIVTAKKILRQKVMRGAMGTDFAPFWKEIGSVPDNIMGSDALISHISKHLPTTPCKPALTLLKTFMDSPSPTFHMPLNGSAVPIWKKDAIRAWFLEVHELVEYYCAAVSFLLGLPVSASFLLNLAIGPNPATGARPNVVIHRGHLSFLSNDATTTNLSARSQYIPNQLGHEILFYLVYVRPLEELWSNIAFQVPSERPSKLWTSALRRWKWDDRDIHQLTENLSRTLMKIQIGKRHWRDITNAILEQHLQIQKKPEGSRNRVADLATGHTSITGDHIYAVGYSYSSSSGTANTSWEQSTRWHGLWGFVKDGGKLDESITGLGKRFGVVTESLNKLTVAQ
ncbi:hypothetical protein B0H12DRAFT_1067216 [Mycena haematopus]|nr:hypothetical protein B0H12DRAFT_1067216 [Mycena haematopus]